MQCVCPNFTSETGARWLDESTELADCELGYSRDLKPGPRRPYSKRGTGGSHEHILAIHTYQCQLRSCVQHCFGMFGHSPFPVHSYP